MTERTHEEVLELLRRENTVMTTAEQIRLAASIMENALQMSAIAIVTSDVEPEGSEELVHAAIGFHARELDRLCTVIENDGDEADTLFVGDAAKAASDAG